MDIQKEDIMKKILALLLALVMVLGLAACGGSKKEEPKKEETTTETTDPAKPYAGRTLYVANWQGYNSDEDYCEKAFEDATGAIVEHVYFNSYEELMTTLMTGGNKTIDAVVLSNNYTQWFHDEGLIMNVDPALLPKAAYLKESITAAREQKKPFYALALLVALFGIITALCSSMANASPLFWVTGITSAVGVVAWLALIFLSWKRGHDIAEGKLGVKMHASISGTVTDITGDYIEIRRTAK